MTNRSKKTGALVGLFFLTFSLLAIQVVFTRLYSYIFTHGYVYLIISNRNQIITKIKELNELEYQWEEMMYD
jgi:hypothetical protein